MWQDCQAPVIAGLYYDLFDSYRGVWFALTGMLLLCLPFALMLKPPKYQRLKPQTNNV